MVIRWLLIFFAEELPLRASGKRPHLDDDDLDVVRREVQRLEMEHIEANR